MTVLLVLGLANSATLAVDVAIVQVAVVAVLLSFIVRFKALDWIRVRSGS